MFRIQRTRALTQAEEQAIAKHLAGERAAEVKRGKRGTTSIYSADQVDRALNAERAERAKKAQEAMRDDSAYFTSPEFREEVIAELVANGATRQQAEGRTRDQLRLFNEARELGLM